MNYEILASYDLVEKKGGDKPSKKGQPVKVQFSLEDTISPRTFLTALSCTAYNLSWQACKRRPTAWVAIGGPEIYLPPPSEISVREAQRDLRYKSRDERTLWDFIAGVPDTRIPAGARIVHPEVYLVLEVVEVRGRLGTYSMDIGSYVDQRGPTEILFRETENCLPAVASELTKPFPLVKRIQEYRTREHREKWFKVDPRFPHL